MTSAKQKEKSAIKHFNKFNTGKGRKRAQDFTYEDLNFNLFDEFSEYLATDASPGRTEGSGQHLALSTAQGYFSSVKMYFIRKFSTRDIPSVFVKEKWSIFTSAISRKIVDRCKRTGEALVTPHEAATSEDCCHIGELCSWAGTLQQIEFWHFCNGMTHLAARGHEIAHQQHKHFSVDSIPEEHQQRNNVINVHVDNWKQHTDQSMVIFPHYDKWQLDYYFSFAMLLALEDAESEYVFPVFSKKAKEFKADGSRKPNTISQHWNNCFKQMVADFGRFRDEMTLNEQEEYILTTHSLNSDLTMHSGKKRSVQEMSSVLDPLPIIFRAGWDLRNAHSFFDYVVR